MQNINLLKKSGIQYDVDGMPMSAKAINTLLLCDDLEKAKIKYSSSDFRIIDLSKRKLIDTHFNGQDVLTLITDRGFKKLEYLKSLNITR